MKKLIVIVLTLISQLTVGQNWQWAKQFSQQPNPNLADELSLYDLKVSSSGNVYATGSFKNHFIYNGVTYNGFPNLTKADIFLGKFDASGNAIWIKTLGSSEGDLPEAIALDNDENVYLIGRIQGTCDFGGGYILNTLGGQDAFIAKYNSSGVIQWAKAVAYGTANDRMIGITVGTDGNIYTTGMSQRKTGEVGEYDFSVGDGTLSTTYHNSDQNSDLYLASYTPTGTYRWSKQIPSNGFDSIFRAITCDDNNNIYVGGALIGTMTIDGNPYTSAGSGDIILLKASPTDGTAEWVRKGGSASNDQLNNIAVYDNYSYLIGFTEGTGTIDSTKTKQSSNFTTAGSTDIFVAKYNLEGRLLWKKTIGSTGGDVGYGLNVYNNILVATGYFANTVNFNLNSITSGGGTDAAFFVFDVESNAVLAKSVSGTLEERGQGVALDSDYNVYLGGYFKSPTLTVGALTPLSNSNSTFNDLFLAKYHNEYTAAFTHKKSVSCNGNSDGELTVTPYFGIPPYTYEWLKDSNPFAATDSAITNLTAGVYQVTVTDDNANAVTLSYTITQPSSIAVGVTKTDVTCYGAQDGTINITITGGTPPYTYFWTTADGCGHDINSEDQTGLSTGTYTVEVTDANGCSASDNITITQPTQIIISEEVPITHIDNLHVKGEIKTTISGGSGSYSSYAWTFNGALFPQTTEDINNLDAGIYEITVTDNTSCSNSKSFTVLDKRVFHAWVSSQTNVNCNGDATGSTTISYAENKGAVSISWSSGENTPSINGKIAGTYTATVTDGNVLPEPDDDITVIIPVTITEPTAVLDGTVVTTPTTCYGDNNGIIDLSPTGGTGPYTYLWNTTPKRVTQDINNLTAGNYEVTITDSKGCTKVVPATVSEPTEITFDFTAVQPLCYGEDNGSLTVKDLTGGVPAYSYLWSNTLTSPTINNLKSGNYWLKVTDSKGCFKTITKNLGEPADITINHLENKPTCPESKNGSIGLTVTGGTGLKTYFWTGPDVAVPSKDQINLGVGTYSVRVTDEAGCFKDYDIVLTPQNSSPVAEITSSEIDNTICASDNVTFTATGGVTYEFFLNSSSIQAESSNANYSTSSLVDNDQVYAVITSEFGCKAQSATITTAVNPLPTVTLEDLTAVCENASALTLEGGLPTGGVYTGTGVNGTEFNPATAGVGTHTITYTFINDKGCVGSASKDITVKALPSPTITTADPLGWCEGASIGVKFTTETADTYQWILNGTDISGATDQTYIATATGAYSVRSTVNGCTATSSETTISTITQTITASTDGPTAWCANVDASVLLKSSPSGALSYQWIKDAADISGAILAEYTATEPGVYAVKAAFTGGCNVTSNNLTLTENPAPVVDIATDTIRIDTKSSVTLDAGPGFASYTWSDNSTQQTLLVDGAITGEGIFKYWVVVTNEYSCSESDTAVVKVSLWDDVTTDYGWTTKLYPNPTTGEFKLQVGGLKNGDYSIAIYNSTGKLVLKRSRVVVNGELNEPINIEKLPKGIYFIQFGSNDKWINKKIVLE